MRKDPLKNILYINLSNKTFEIRKRPELFEEYLGGTGVATKILTEEVPPETDPYSPDNAIILATGPIVGVFPMASKAVAMFKSPLTGNLGESHAGGRTSTSIRSAGLGAIVIKGKSPKPVYIVIDGHMVYFRDARTFWGMKSSREPRYSIAKRESNSGFRTILVTGPAADKQVSYASVVSESYRHFGRLGLGAVFGSKNLKAIQIGGKYAIPVKDKKQYRKIYKTMMERCTEPNFIQKYRGLGTAENVLPLNEIEGLPTRNLTQTTFENAENISGEHLQKKYLARRIACSMCPVACIHLAALREPFKFESYFYKTTLVSYDYELIYALGSMLGVGETNDMLKLLVEVENLGLDAISTGVCLAWACEALEKQKITQKETIVPLEWGNANIFIKAMNHIVNGTNDFYLALAKGSEYAAKKFGGMDFLTTFGGLEMAGYHTGPTQALGFLFGTRHSHLDSGPYSFDIKMGGSKKYPTEEEIVDYIIEEESWRQVLTSLVICLFARKVYDEESILNCLKEVDYEFSLDELLEIGKKIYRMKNSYKKKCGVNFNELFPYKRIFETPAAIGKNEIEFFKRARDLMAKRINELIENSKDD